MLEQNHKQNKKHFNIISVNIALKCIGHGIANTHDIGVAFDVHTKTELQPIRLFPPSVL